MRRPYVFLVALVLASSLAGCGRLLGSRYDNFTAYYNTYYNAREEFEREEEKLLKAERPVDRERFLTLFVGPQDGARSNPGFENAIQKGADVLKDHPESKWLDDALLLIGKSRFYLSNWAGAEEKFREVIGLGDSELEDEAWLWLGRSLTAAERYDDAALALREGLGRDGVEERWAAPMRLALAEVDVRRSDFDAAIESLQAGLEGLRDDRLAARGAFLLGQVYEVQDRPAEAADAYDRVLSYGPRYELAYAAQISRALALGLGPEPERGLEILRRMRRDDKNFPSLAEVELTRARVLAAAERPAEARDLLRTLLYDPDPSIRIGALQGQAHYRLADVYRTGLRDYVRAAAHYDTAATALRQPVAAEIQTTREAIIDATDRSGSFGSFARVSAEVAALDSLLYLGRLDDDAFAVAIEEIRRQRQAEAEAAAREQARRRAEEGFGGVAAGPTGGGNRGRGGAEESDEGAGGAGVPAAAADFGFLSYRNPVRVQDQLIGFQAQWGDRPLVPNWRRAEAVAGAIAVQSELQESIEGVGGVTTPNFAREELVDVSAVPRDPISQRQMELDLAAAQYELGNVLFLSLNEPDTAAEWYQRVLDAEAESALAQRAYFALAETQRALGNEAEAEDLYQQVLDLFSESSIADQARDRLGLAPRERVAVADSLADAEALYALAFGAWRSGEYGKALDQMLTVGEQYPTTPTAARARLAAGTLYTEWAAGDSTALLAATPQLDGVQLVVPTPAPTPVAVDSARAVVDSLSTVEEVPLEEVVGQIGEERAGEDDLIPADSAAVPADALAQSDTSQPPDSVVYDEPWLYALYASIELDYPGTRYAERARATRTALAERYAIDPPRPDDGEEGRADSTGAEPDAPQLSIVRAGPAAAPGAEALRQDAEIRPALNEFSWVIFSTPRRPQAVETVLALADLGYTTALLIDPDRTEGSFRVIVGQFGSEQSALGAVSALPTVRAARIGPSIISLNVEARRIQSPSQLRGNNDQ